MLTFSVANSQNANKWDTGETPAAIAYTHAAGAIHIVDVSAQRNEALNQSFAGTTTARGP